MCFCVLTQFVIKHAFVLFRMLAPLRLIHSMLHHIYRILCLHRGLKVTPLANDQMKQFKTPVRARHWSVRYLI